MFFAEVEGVGAHHAVNLVSDVSALPDQEAARTIATALAGPFREAVASLQEARDVADPARRKLFGLDG